MQQTGKIILTIAAAFFITGCGFIKNAFTYKDKTEEFIQIILKEDYERALECLAIMTANLVLFV